MAVERGGQIALCVVYLFLVSVVIAFIAPIGFNEEFSPMNVETPSFASTYKFTGNGTGGVIPSDFETDSGEWALDSTAGYVSVGTGTNRLLLAGNYTDFNHLNINQRYVIVNGNNTEFNVFVTYVKFLWILPMYREYKFSPSGIVWHEEYDKETIPWPVGSGVSNATIDVNLKPESEIPGHHTVVLTVNGQHIDEQSIILSNPFGFPFWPGGIEVEGAGFSLIGYSRNSYESPSSDFLSATVDFVTLMGYTLGFTLPWWLFDNTVDFLISLAINVLFVKSVMIYLGVMILEIWRGN